MRFRDKAVVITGGSSGFDPDKAVEQLNRTVPLGRIAEPEDIADVIAFLASDDARYIAGATVEVTGAKPVY